MKRYLSSTAILVAPKPQEPLLLYLAATNQVVSAVLVAQREPEGEVAVAAETSDGGPGSSPAEPEPPARPEPGKAEPEQMSEVGQKKKMVQHLVYFVSSLLQGARSRYSGMQKLLFGLLMASRKLLTIFKRTRSPSSPASLCNESCTTQMQLGRLWSGH